MRLDTPDETGPGFPDVRAGSAGEAGPGDSGLGSQGRGADSGPLNQKGWGSFIKENSVIVGAVGAGAIAGGALTVVALPAAVAAVGFTAAGPAAGSLAASWMSAAAIAGNGGVAAGSMFATVQSAAMTGAFASSTVAAAGSAVGGCTSAAAKFLWSQKPEGPSDGPDSNDKSPEEAQLQAKPASPSSCDAVDSGLSESSSVCPNVYYVDAAGVATDKLGPAASKL